MKENKHLAELTKSLQNHALDLENQYRHQLIMNEDLLQFSKIISHDLQEPIRKIQIFTDMIVNDADTVISTRSKDLLPKIDNATARLATLITALREYIVIDEEEKNAYDDLNVVIEAAKARAANSRVFFDFDMEVEHLPSNLAEGTGRFTKPDKRNFYIISRSFVFECIAILDVLRDEAIIEKDRF